MKMPPKEKTIIPPAGGWKERTYYVVETAINPCNVVHRAIFYSGFLDKGEPAGYNVVWNATYSGATHKLHKYHYLKVISEIGGI